MDALVFPPRGGGRGHQDRAPLSRWVSADDLPDSWTYRPGMLLLGQDSKGRKLGVLDNRHIVTVAGSRSGKTRTLLIPNLRHYPGPMVVFDPKGELYRLTAAQRRAMGQKVWQLAPFDEDGKSDNFNPFGRLKRSSLKRLAADVAQLAESMIEGNKHDSHWTNSAKNLLIGLILLGHLTLPHGVTIRWLREMLTDPPRLKQAWKAMAASDAFGGRLKGIGKTFLSKTGSEDGEAFDNRELQSILSTAQEQTRPLDDVADISDHSDFSFEEFVKQPATLYCELPGLLVGTHARWLRMIFYNLLNTMERNPIDVEGGKMPLRFVLEEFAALGHLEAVETAAGYIAGSGVLMWVILQNLTQIRTHYPNSWETFIGNSEVINTWNVVDGTTTRYFSDQLGNTTIMESRQTRLNSGGVRGGDPGFDSSPRSVPLLEPSELGLHFARQTGRQLILVPGYPPIHMQRLPLE